MFHNYKKIIAWESFGSNIEWIFGKHRLLLLVTGLPGAGKTTFIENYIIPNHSEIKHVATDKVMANLGLRAYTHKATELRDKQLRFLIKKGCPIVWDTVGHDISKMDTILNYAKENAYIIVGCHLHLPYDRTKRQYIERGTNVDMEYFEKVAGKENDTVEYLKTPMFDAGYLVRPGISYSFTSLL